MADAPESQVEGEQHSQGNPTDALPILPTSCFLLQEVDPAGAEGQRNKTLMGKLGDSQAQGNSVEKAIREGPI